MIRGFCKTYHSNQKNASHDTQSNISTKILRFCKSIDYISNCLSDLIIRAKKDECYAEVKDIHREFEVVRYGKKGKSYIDNLLKKHDVNEQIFSAFKKDKSMMDAIKQSILKAIEEDRVRRMSK